MTNKTISFRNANLVTPNRIIENGYLHVKDGKIEAIGKMDQLGDLIFQTDLEKIEIVDVKGKYIVPGLIDIHTHGGAGADVMDGVPEAFITIANAHAKHGVTSILPTTLTSSFADLTQVIKAFKIAKTMNDSYEGLLGLHLEGPYFCPAMSGAQNLKYLCNPKPEEYLPILMESVIKRWSVAPELPGALEMGRELRKYGVLAAIGHSEADYDTVVAAVDAGYSHITHLYSCTSTVTRKNAFRIAGVIEASYLLDGLTVEIIADGKHLPPELLKLVYKVKGPERIILVSDSMRALGLPEGDYYLGGQDNGQKVIVKNGVAAFPDWSSLAGGVQGGNQLVKNMVEFAEVPLTEAVGMMTVNPAKVLGISGFKGKLDQGMDADLALMDHNFEIWLTMIEGKIVYRR